MFRIKRKADARYVTDMLVSENPGIERIYCTGYKVTRPFLKVYDSPEDNLILVYLDKRFDGVAYQYLILYLDTVNGLEGQRWMYGFEITRIIWSNRDIINKSKQLKNLEKPENC